MISLIPKFQPLAAIVLAALLYAVYYWLLRLKTRPALAQTFIAASVVAATVFTFVTPARVVVPVASDELPAQELAAMQPSQPTAAPSAARLVPSGSNATTGDGLNLTGTASDSLSSDYAKGRISLTIAYAAGVVAMLCYLAMQLLWYTRERRRSTLAQATGEATVYTTAQSQPFSFGRSIFVPAALTAELSHYVLLHELCHVRRRHFLKLCLLELLLAANWFNPFVWLFFNELKLQQELEVDNDVLAQGIDRERYQLSLLQMTVQQSRWLLVQSAFGAKPIKQRIIFMNNSFDTRSMGRRLRAAAAATLLVAGAAGTTSCLMNAKAAPADDQHHAHHAIYGVWQMDYTRRADSSTNIYPPFKQYAFYSDDVFFTPHLYTSDGHNFQFGYSGEGLAMKGDTLVGGRGLPLVYRFVNKTTFQSDWTAEEGDLYLAGGKVNTDQWSRATPGDELLAAFHAACEAAPNKSRRLDGVWRATQLDNGYENYLLVNNTLAVRISIRNSKDPGVLRFSGGGYCGDVTYSGDTGLTIAHIDYTINWAADGQSFVISNSKEQSKLWQQGLRFERTGMPDHIGRIVRSTLIQNP